MPIINVCGLWKNEKKDGTGTYLSGKSGFIKYLIFKNERKENDRSPDYRLCIADIDKKKEDKENNNEY
jgi:hypothetical protein